MLPTPIVEVIAGTTLKATFVNSGVTPGAILSELLDSEDAMVSSFTPVSSGNGHYFALHVVPTSQPWYVNRWWATIDANTYQYRQLVRAHKLEV